MGMIVGDRLTAFIVCVTIISKGKKSRKNLIRPPSVNKWAVLQNSEVIESEF
jgi:hypothetical protein